MREKEYCEDLRAKEVDLADQELLADVRVPGSEIGLVLHGDDGPVLIAQGSHQAEGHGPENELEDLEDAGDLAEVVAVEAGRAGDGGVHGVGRVALGDGVVEGLGRCGHHSCCYCFLGMAKRAWKKGSRKFPSATTGRRENVERGENGENDSARHDAKSNAAGREKRRSAEEEKFQTGATRKMALVAEPLDMFRKNRLLSTASAMIGCFATWKENSASFSPTLA